MRKLTMKGAVYTIAAAALIATIGPVNAQQYYGGGWDCGRGYGSGMMNGYGPGMMGPGMMGGNNGYGPGMMGPGMMGWGNGYGPGAGAWGPQQQANLNLSVDQVRNNMTLWLKNTGNPRLKLGKVAEKDADTITADVVTVDKDALVQRYEINRHSGFFQPLQ